MYIWLGLYFLFIFSSYHVNCVILQTKQGTLRGETLVSRDGRPFYAFYKIPYAEPPVGNLRFKNPAPPKSWDGVRDATILPPPCISHERHRGVIGQEDCLYLNVYTPKITNDTLIPVMVFIYGGRFMYGDALPSSYGAHYFMDEDVILITFHYRLGALGFLSTEDEVIPGNYGLKDTVAVLHWIQNYIEGFGGDKNRVTVFGGSSGAATVDVLLVSPLATGLFHRAISQSGDFFGFPKPGAAKILAWKYASLIGCGDENETTSKALLACLMKLPAEKLAEHNSKLYYLGYLLPSLPFSPVIENEKVPGAFLVDETAKLLARKTDIPWIKGINTDDGAMMAIFTYFNPIASVIDDVEKDYKKHFPVIFGYHDQANNTEELDRLTETYVKYYFGDKSLRENAHGFSKMGTCLSFLPGIKKTAKLYKGPLYVYQYDHRNKETFAHTYGNFEEEMGVIHGDELISMFNWSSVITPVTEGIDYTVSKQILRLWTNFAAKGDPNDDNDQLWKPVDSLDINYLHIKGESFEMKNALMKSEFEFLESVRAKVD